MNSNFLYTVCQVGSEKALKEELAVTHPKLKFAFSRPGFITFKSEVQMGLDFKLDSIFAREYGLSLSRIDENHANELAKLVETYQPDYVFSFERDQHRTGEEPKGYVDGEWLKEVPIEYREKARLAKIEPGNLILDLCVVDPGRWFVGIHKHSYQHTRWPGGRPSIPLPDQAPSRAYLKCVEAMEWARLPVKRDDFAIELGSAPGGASFALLERGLHVIAVDSAEMDPALIAEFPRELKFIHRLCENVDLSRLPERIDWLLMDMNIPPDRALWLLKPYLERYQGTLRGLVLTLKLNDWSYAAHLRDYAADIRLFGFQNVRLRQLSYNKQEVCLVASR